MFAEVLIEALYLEMGFYRLAAFVALFSFDLLVILFVVFVL